MKLSYRTRRALRKLGQIAAVLLAVGIVAFALWFTWLDRFVVYSREQGAQLDFSMNVAGLSGQVAVKPDEIPPVSVFYNDGQLEVESEELTKLNGYYLTSTQLQQYLREDLDGLLEKLQELPRGTAIMFDVKDMYGNFFYSSTVSSNRSSTISTEDMDKLLDYLKKNGTYTIARVPALRDYNYVLHHVSDGRPTAGGSLCMDDDSGYWLNPGI